MINFSRFGSLQWFGILAVASFTASCLMSVLSIVALPPAILVCNGVVAGVCLSVIDWRLAKRDYAHLDSRHGMPSSEALFCGGLSKQLILLVAERHAIDVSALSTAKAKALINAVQNAQQEDYPTLAGVTSTIFLSTKRSSVDFLQELSRKSPLED